VEYNKADKNVKILRAHKAPIEDPTAAAIP
jgi:hypothetical protein